MRRDTAPAGSPTHQLVRSSGDHCTVAQSMRAAVCPAIEPRPPMRERIAAVLRVIGLRVSFQPEPDRCEASVPPCSLRCARLRVGPFAPIPSAVYPCPSQPRAAGGGCSLQGGQTPDPGPPSDASQLETDVVPTPSDHAEVVSDVLLRSCDASHPPCDASHPPLSPQKPFCPLRPLRPCGFAVAPSSPPARASSGVAHPRTDHRLAPALSRGASAASDSSSICWAQPWVREATDAATGRRVRFPSMSMAALGPGATTPAPATGTYSELQTPPMGLTPPPGMGL